jgi:AraC-like DNA-binding protein
MASWLSRAPAAPLASCIARLWTSARSAGLPHAREWNLPTGHADLVLPLDRSALRRFDGLADAHGHWLAGGVLQGPMLRPTLRDTASASIVVGVQFRPGGLPALLGLPADAVAGRTLALDTLWPGWADALRDRVAQAGLLHDPAGRLQCLEDALRLRWPQGGTLDALVAWALPRLQAGMPIAQVQRAAGVSPTTFIRRYRAACGLTPVQHRALQRLQAALAAGQAGQTWADAAHDSGFADQAHMGREFRRLAWHTPGQVRRLATGWPSHLACT